MQISSESPKQELQLTKDFELISIGGPEGRFGHLLFEHSKYIYIFGGSNDSSPFFNELYEFDLTLHNWKKCNTKNTIPGLCYASHVKYCNELFVFGGYALGFQNILYKFNFDLLKWYIIGRAPFVRSGHSCNLWNKEMILFGGYDGTKFNNDLWKYNFETQIWKEIKYNENYKIMGREKHQSVIYMDDLYIFGGWENEQFCLGDFWSFNLKSLKWKQIISNIPCARSAHIMVINDENIYLFGGFNNQNLDDFYKYNIPENHWTRYTITTPYDVKTLARRFAAGVVKDDWLYIFGGYANWYSNETLRIKLDPAKPKLGRKIWNIVHKRKFIDCSIEFL